LHLQRVGFTEAPRFLGTDEQGRECLSYIEGFVPDNIDGGLTDEQFDMARPGARIRDVSYGLFLWLNLGWDGPPPDEQRRRIHLWCDAYGLADTRSLIAEVEQRVIETVARRRDDGAEDAARWWHTQLDWLELHEGAIAP